MLRNIDLKTYQKVVKKTAASFTVGGIVPAGMKRWVTFVQFSPFSSDSLLTRQSHCGLYVASVVTQYPTVASVLLAANRKAILYLRCTRKTGVIGGRKPPLRFPDAPTIKAPILSIAAGKYLGLVATGTSVSAFVQYFDE
ncbi:hypothetical protein KKH23_05490 [Patescibacteria group bacterium]|nr:hypothetical protein [Patescibacteria group bacterium]